MNMYFPLEHTHLGSTLPWHSRREARCILPGWGSRGESTHHLPYIGEANIAMSTLFTSDLHSLKRFRQGKVRDIYEVDAEHLLIVATDRLSAFDVVLPTPIPDKGRILTAMANFWFAHTAALVPNHLTTR